MQSQQMTIQVLGLGFRPIADVPYTQVADVMAYGVREDLESGRLPIGTMRACWTPARVDGKAVVAWMRVA